MQSKADDQPQCPDGFRIVEDLTDQHVEQLHALIQQQWWGGKRTLDDVKIMVENTGLMVGIVDCTTDLLVGYCRVLTDFVFRATINDVMVDQEFQGRGLGKCLLDVLSSHPKLQRVSVVYLACEPGMFPFYERWGFKVYESRAEWMVKVQREEL